MLNIYIKNHMDKPIIDPVEPIVPIVDDWDEFGDHMIF